jgi:ATP-dependent Clp protease ATP-binding subunit ClpC
MRIKIEDFFNEVEKNGGTYKIKTPSGYKLIGNLFKKTKKYCYSIKLSNGTNLSGSESHLVETTFDTINNTVEEQNNSYWLSLKNINVGDLVWCEDNQLYDVIEKTYLGIHDTFDLEVLDEERKYLTNGISSHNCGKTAIVEGLAMKIYLGECPRSLENKRIVLLDLTSIVAGTKYRGQFEERLKVILEELQNNPDIIVFIDEIHTLVGAGNSSGSLDASNIFKPALARGEIQCIGATTLDEYRENFEKDGALERRFQKVVVDSPSKEETLKILKNVKDKYEFYHRVSYSDEVLDLCVNLADRYITDREFPDKAFDIIDEVGARSQVDIELPEIINRLKDDAHKIKEDKLLVVKQQDYEKAAELRDKEKKVVDKLNEEKKKFEETLLTKRKEVTLELVYDVVSTMTKIPISKLNTDDVKNLLSLEKNIGEKVVGQEEAITKMAKAIRRNRLGIRDPNRPIGAFILLGNSGVGKTHLAKQMAKEIFGNEDNLIRIDMSEYQEKHSVSRLVGAPPGYVGYDKGGQLTEQVKNKPYSVILFDEVEKANKEVFSILLRVLDEGFITDSLGRKINFRNSLIILTSNLGVKKIQDFGSGIGFGKNSFANEEVKRDIIQKEMKNFFAPEFLNRIDEVVVFNTLKENDIKEIVKIELDKLMDRLHKMKYLIAYDKSLVEHIAKVGFDPQFGARPLKRAIQECVEDLISEEILKGEIVEMKKYKLKFVKDVVKLEKGK